MHAGGCEELPRLLNLLLLDGPLPPSGSSSGLPPSSSSLAPQAAQPGGAAPFRMPALRRLAVGWGFGWAALRSSLSASEVSLTCLEVGGIISRPFSL